MKRSWILVVLVSLYVPVASAFDVDFEAVRIGAPPGVAVPNIYPDIESLESQIELEIASGAPYGNLRGNVLRAVDPDEVHEEPVYIAFKFAQPVQRFVFDVAYLQLEPLFSRHRVIVTCLASEKFVYDYGFNLEVAPSGFYEGTVDFDNIANFGDVECDEIRISTSSPFFGPPHLPLGHLAVDCLRVDEALVPCQEFQGLVAELLEEGALVQRQADALLRIYRVIDRQISRGNVRAAINNSRRMIRYTNRRRGRGITDEAAEHIVAFAVDLIAELSPICDGRSAEQR